jgi:DNA-3-methyladenine glycosylase
VRALEPLGGIEAMQERRGVTAVSRLCAGPGRLCQALGITGALDGAPLTGRAVRILPGRRPPPRAIARGPRIGITRAADWPLRFWLGDSAYLSK